MEFSIGQIVVFYEFLNPVTPEYAEEVRRRIRENRNSHVFVCPEALGDRVSEVTNITMHSSVLSAEEIGAVLFDAMDGNVVFGGRKEPGKHNIVIKKLKIRYDFDGDGSEEYPKTVYELIPKDGESFVHYGDSSLYVWTQLSVDEATNMVWEAVHKIDERMC